MYLAVENLSLVQFVVENLCSARQDQEKHDTDLKKLNKTNEKREKKTVLFVNSRCGLRGFTP
jgi:hypothetical protein